MMPRTKDVAKVENRTEQITAAVMELPAKRRGRKPGSKNKPKPPQTQSRIVRGSVGSVIALEFDNGLRVEYGGASGRPYTHYNGFINQEGGQTLTEFLKMLPEFRGDTIKFCNDISYLGGDQTLIDNCVKYCTRWISQNTN